VLHLYGRAAAAVPDRFPALGSLTQLRSMQLDFVAVDVESELFIAALSPLTQLTRLDVHFGDDGRSHEHGMALPAFPWEDAICGLINLQELRVASSMGGSSSCCGMFKGALPAELSQLTALRHLEVLGMGQWDAADDFDNLQLAALPALETGALLLQQSLSAHPSGLGPQPQQRVELRTAGQPQPRSARGHRRR